MFKFVNPDVHNAVVSGDRIISFKVKTLSERDFVTLDTPEQFLHPK